MFSRRSLFSRVRDAALALTVPAVAAHVGIRSARAQDPDPDAAQPEGGFATMPFDNPPYGAPPLTFGERSGVTIVVKTDADLVRALVPGPLEPKGSELMVQQHRNTIISPQREIYPNATVIVPVSFNDADGFYMARVYEGSADATMLTIWGREVYGFPKIAADTDVTREGNRAKSYVRATNAWASVELDLGEELVEEPAATLNLYCRKTIPSCDGQGVDLDRIIEVPWRHTPEQRVPATVKNFHLRLDVGGKPVKVPVEEFVDSFWFTQDTGTVLDKGKVVHDYLA